MFSEKPVAETPKEFSRGLVRLQALACPSPEDEALFAAQMDAAKAAGMTYREGLEHVIRMRSGGSD